jgi:hypothetical protein
MQAQDSFKKGDFAYIIAVDSFMKYESMIVECKIEKITTADRIKSHEKKDTYRSRKNKVSSDFIKALAPQAKEGEEKEWFEQHFPNHEDFPKMAWVSFHNPFKKRNESKWHNMDSIQKTPEGFLNLINDGPRFF